MQGVTRSTIIAAPLLFMMLGMLSAMPAVAQPRCEPLTGAAASVDKFIAEVHAMQLSGSGNLPVRDALFGFQDLNAADQQDLGARAPIKVVPQDEDAGIFVNSGPKPVSITGSFADSTTYFDIPELVSGSYISTPDSLTLIYDPQHAVKVGQEFLGIKISKTINHTIITRDSVAYFFDTNSGGKPDRCYTLTKN